MTWIAGITKGRRELEAQARLKNQGYEAYVPICRVQKGKNKAEVLFPNYIFINIQFGEDAISPIENTPCMSKLVRFGNNIPTVDEAVIDHLKIIAGDMKIIELENDFYSEGDVVRIKSGVLKFYEGVVQAKSRTDRVNVLLDLLGRQVVMELNTNEIESR